MTFKAQLDRIAFAAHLISLDGDVPLHFYGNEGDTVMLIGDDGDPTITFIDQEIEVNDNGAAWVKDTNQEERHLVFTMVRPMIEQDLEI